MGRFRKAPGEHEGIFSSHRGYKLVKGYGEYRNKEFDAIIKNDGIALPKEEFYEILNFLKGIEKYYKSDAFNKSLEAHRKEIEYARDNEFHKESVRQTSYVKE